MRGSRELGRHEPRLACAAERTHLRLVVPVLVLAALGLIAATHLGIGAIAPSAAQQILQAYDQRPLTFEINEGQADPRADVLSRGRAHRVLIGPAEVTLSHTRPMSHSGESSLLRMKLAGANQRSRKSLIDRQPGTVNYFLGNDPTKWRRNVSTYAKVQYHEVYPGIDVVYYGNQRELEYDLIVAPGADPSTVTLEFEGVNRVELDARGALVLSTAVGPVGHLKPPNIFQHVDGFRRVISGSYMLKDLHRVGFQIAPYDTTRPLVIDPVLVYAAHLGGGGSDSGYGIATDAEGNVYVTGDTRSTDLPVTNPAQRAFGGAVDVFVTKLSADGSKVLYSTYLGGGDADVGYGIAVDVAGNVYVTGDTRSNDFPLVNPVQRSFAGSADAFVAKLSADGSQLLYSTYLGGSDGERGLAIAVDGAGSAYVTGYTNSLNFPVVNAFQATFGGGDADVFVTKLNASGSALVYSTYLGGRDARPELGTGIAVDTFGNAYVTGFTNSPDFPTVKPLQPFRGPTDAFVTKLNPAGSALIYSTHLGGGADDQAMAIAVDADGNAYVTGHTESLDFPTTTGAFRTSCAAIPVRLPIGDICAGGDAFVSKLAADGSSLVYSTYLSGRGFEVGRGIGVDAARNAYVTGFTTSRDFPTMNALQRTFGGGVFDAFVVKLNRAGSALAYSTFLGGSGEDGGYGIAVDPEGHAYVTGYTTSPDFPGRNASRTPALGSRNVFVVKISDSARTPSAK